MSKPNFNTNLHFGKTLDLLNELNEHKIEASFSSGEVEYFICEINDRTKNLLCNLGVIINELPEDFYQEKDLLLKYDIPVLTEENGPGECPYQYKGGQDNG